MPELEKTLTDQVRRYLNKRKKAGDRLWYMKVAGNPMQRRGVPDFLVIQDGQYYWFELKAEKGKVSKMQEATMNSIEKAGGCAWVIRELDELKEVLETRSDHA